jgi:hypothetical protein
VKQLTYFLLSIFLSSCGQKSINDLANEAAEDCLKAANQYDYQKTLTYMCPLKIAEHGGKEKTLQFLQEVAKRVKLNTDLCKVELGEIEEVKIINGTTYVHLSYNVLTDSPQNTKDTNLFFDNLFHKQIVNKSQIDLIGVSKDQGQTWWFIDGPLTTEQFQKYLPELVGKMTIPTMGL